MSETETDDLNWHESKLNVALSIYALSPEVFEPLF